MYKILLPMMVVLLSGCSSTCKIGVVSVQDVGPCDDNGRCLVQFENGQVGHAMYPQIGQQLRTCK